MARYSKFDLDSGWESFKKEFDLASDKEIEDIRRDIRYAEFGDMEVWDRGGCHLVTEALEGIDGAIREVGYFIASNPQEDGRREVIDHFWLRMPDNSIIDPTYDSINPGNESVGRFSAGDEGQQHYYPAKWHERSWHRIYSHPDWDPMVAAKGYCDECLDADKE
jgi:hypothetical protein